MKLIDRWPIREHISRAHKYSLDRDRSLKKNEIAQLQIDDLAFGGRGVAKDDGKVIFVDGGLPGDTVMARITRVKPDYCESRVAQIIAPSPHRLKAPCQHFDICGGCKWQD